MHESAILWAVCVAFNADWEGNADFWIRILCCDQWPAQWHGETEQPEGVCIRDISDQHKWQKRYSTLLQKYSPLFHHSLINISQKSQAATNPQILMFSFENNSCLSKMFHGIKFAFMFTFPFKQKPNIIWWINL